MKSIEACVYVLLTCAATVEPLRLLGGGCAHGGMLLDPRSSCAKQAPVMGGQRAPLVDVNLKSPFTCFWRERHRVAP
jgi:hypothetical protein